MKEPELATQGQLRALRGLIRATGEPMTNAQANTLKMLTKTQASEYITKLKTIETMRAPETPGLATRKQVAYFAEVRRKANRTVTQEEVASFRKLSTKDANTATVKAMRELQDYRDSKNVPIPDWRLERGLHGLNGPVRTRKAEQA